MSIKLGRSIEKNASCQFDDRTEESSAVQYFQVNNCSFCFFSIIHLNSYLVLWLFISTTKYDARLYTYINISTSYS
jgi:hypothetical protein